MSYYRCAGSKGCKRFYPEKLLEDETLRLLSSLQISESVSEWAFEGAFSIDCSSPLISAS